MVTPRLSSAAVLAACVLSVLSCGIADTAMFPAALAYTAAERDAYADFRAAGLTDPIWIGDIELLRAPGSGRSVLFVFAADYGEMRLFAYDPDTLKLRRSYDGAALSPLLSISPSGNYLCGGTEIDPETLEAVSSSAPTYVFGWGDTLALRDPASSALYVFYPGSVGLACLYFTPASWETSTPLWLGEVPILADGTTNHRPADLLYGSAGEVRLLFASDGIQRVLSFSSLAGLLAAYSSSSSLDAAASAVAVLPGSSDQPGAWLTLGGTVRLSRDGETKFVRHNLDTGKEIDSWTEERVEGQVRYHFLDSGARWLSLSKDSGTLRLLRTWW